MNATALPRQSRSALPSDSRQIQLTRGYFAIVDAEDFEWLSEFKWQAIPFAHTTYARCYNRVTRRNSYMHRLVMGASVGESIDHANRNGLDNRRSNLRKCTQSQNGANSVKVTGISGYRGVAPSKSRWKVVARINGRITGLGTFASAISAARAYDKLVLEHFGEFATLNFPPERDWIIPHEHAGQWPPKVTSAHERERSNSHV